MKIKMGNSSMVIYFAAICCLTLSCNSQEKSNIPTVVENHVDTTKNIKSKSVAISQTEYSMIKGSREFVFSFMDEGEHFTPLFTDHYIGVSALKQYLQEQNSNNEFDGIRIYPGLRNNRIVSILCLAKSDPEDELERAYMILEDVFYFEHSQLPIIDDDIIVQEASLLHNENYMSQIMIYRNSQIPHDSIRYSRFYKLSQIENLISQNNNDGTIPDSELLFRLEAGYVDKHLATPFRNWLYISDNNDDFKEELMQGYTIVLTLTDRNGNQLIDPALRVSDPTNFQKMYMEVGLPCPPRCGSLHQ